MKEFNQKLQEQLSKMCKTGKLFRTAISGQELWKIYIDSFVNDPIFRDPNSTEHNCNSCHNFMRRYGNIIALDSNYEIITIFDIEIEGEFEPVAKALSEALRKSKVVDIFFETFQELNSLPYESCNRTNAFFQLGMAKNTKMYNKEEADKYGVVKEGEIRTFNHMNLSLPRDFVDMSDKSIEAISGEFRDSKNVFQRAMETISLDTLHLVRDLINQGSLLDGTTHLYKVEQFIPLKQEYDSLSVAQRDGWCWVKSYRLPIAKFRNELIGVLCSELSEGEELNKACQSWNKRVDPANYMKATAPITKKQIEEAKKFVEENGYVASFDRRLATMDDIKVSEVLHSNVGEGKVKSVSIFDGVKPNSTRHKRSEFEGVEEVGIDKFMEDILPTCTSVEAFLANSHNDNLVSLTTANKEDSKPIFKWDNNYSWTFNGNLAGKSQIKEAVIEKGGNVGGVLRFSMIWNDAGKDDNSDLDAWCREADGGSIGYSTGFRRDYGDRYSVCGGQLDLDNTQPNGKLAVENIYYKDLKKMKRGIYRFWVNQYSARNSQGFKAEIEFDGEIYSYEYNRPVSGNVNIAEVTLENGKFTIKHLLPESGVSSKEVYGLETNHFHKVNLVCLSPNHWGSNKVGNKHFFFMLEGCKTPTSVRGFHNENLLPELAVHRKVLEVLGATNMVAPSGKQLSGLGFNATVRDELVVRLQGTHKRMLKIKF